MLRITLYLDGFLFDGINRHVLITLRLLVSTNGMVLDLLECHARYARVSKQRK